MNQDFSRTFTSESTEKLIFIDYGERPKDLNKPLMWCIYTTKVVTWYNLVGSKMLTKKQLKVIDAFRKHIGTKLTAEQIKEISSINSNKFLYKALSNCMNENIMTNEQVGKSLLYHLEINNKSALYLGMLATEVRELPQDVLSHIERELSKKLPLFIGLVFGSYARGNQKKNSDLDIAIIVDDKNEVGIARSIMESIKLKEIIEIHSNVFELDEFKEMLSDDLQNVGKEILKNHYVFYNPTVFYLSIKQWIP